MAIVPSHPRAVYARRPTLTRAVSPTGPITLRNERQRGTGRDSRRPIQHPNVGNAATSEAAIVVPDVDERRAGS